MSDFEWQTEEVTEWPEVAALPPEPEQRPQWRWFLALVVVCLLALAGWVVYRQMNQRLAAAAAHVEADVLPAHTVVRQAAQQQDVELLESVLSGRDRRWTEAQKALVEAGLLFDASAFGFQMQPAEANFPVTRSDNITITLSADLTAAEVSWLQPFIINTDKQVTETVTVLQNAVYRQGERSWLLSPPEPEFWGEWEQVQGAYTTLTYPARDDPIARRLVHDLDAVIVRICTQLEGITCPPGLSLRLRLETDAGSLLAVRDAETVLTSGRNLGLPAPTLMGVPIDETGYQALVRGYAVHVASALITDLVGYQCCEHGHFYAALLDRQLSQLGLRPWPLTQADYDGLLDEPFDRQDGFVWNRSLSDTLNTVEKRQLYTLIDFLLVEAAPQAMVAEMERQLNHAVTYWNWLKLFNADHYRPRQFKRAWLQFIYQQTASAQSPPPIPLTEEDIQLVCRSRSRFTNYVYRYNLRTSTWSTPFEYRSEGSHISYVIPVSGQPDMVAVRDGYFGAATAERKTRLSLWRDGQKVAVFEVAADEFGRTPALYSGPADPTGRYVVLIRYDRRSNLQEYELIDLDSCRNSRCNTQPLLNRPHWSSGGSYTLMSGQPLSTTTTLDETYLPWLTSLFRADARGRSPVEVGTGLSPFWFSDERYGFVRVNEAAEFELVTAIAGDDKPHVLATGEQLRQALPPTERPDELFLGYVAVSPANNRQLVVATSSSLLNEAQHYLFRLTLDDTWSNVTDVSLVHQADGWSWVALSPDGRWLAIHDYRANERTIELIDLHTGANRMLQDNGLGLSWSSDGQWLVVSIEDRLTILAPAYNYRQLVFHDFDHCDQVDWVGEE